MTTLKTGAKRESLLDWAMRNGYDVVAVNRAWRDGRLCALQHSPEGKLVVEPTGGLRLHELRPGARRSADIGSQAGPTIHESERPSLQARLDPRGHDREARINAAKREHAEHDRKRSSRPRANASKGAEPVSVSERIRAKRSNGRD